LSRLVNDQSNCTIEAAKCQKRVEAILSEDSFDKVLQEAGGLQKYLEEQYKLAKARHAKEKTSLETNFDYHRPYKRGIAKREFTGTFFTPVAHPKQHTT